MSDQAKTKSDHDLTAADAAAAPLSTGKLEAGSKLSKYVVRKLLGKGGMGAVYEATDSVLARKVALKVLRPSFAQNQQALKRFLQEARLAAQLNHPNVVTVHDVGRDGDSVFIVMEMVAGASADDLIKREGGLGFERATRYIADACRALVAAHGAGMIHRDIKPANILIGTDGAVKVSDFGLAKSLGKENMAVTRREAILGTPHYMSPEQCQNQNVDARTDLYALGASYYALLTGKAPYRADTALQVLYAHCNLPVPDPREDSVELPEVCTRLINRAMQKDPAERYQSAVEMLADLELALSSGGSAEAVAVGEAPAGGGIGFQDLLHEIDPSARSETRLRHAAIDFAHQQQMQRKPAVESRTRLWIGGGVAAAVVLIAAVLMLNSGSGERTNLALNSPKADPAQTVTTGGDTKQPVTEGAAETKPSTPAAAPLTNPATPTNSDPAVPTAPNPGTSTSTPATKDNPTHPGGTDNTTPPATPTPTPTPIPPTTNDKPGTESQPATDPPTTERPAPPPPQPPEGNEKPAIGGKENDPVWKRWLALERTMNQAVANRNNSAIDSAANALMTFVRQYENATFLPHREAADKARYLAETHRPGISRPANDQPKRNPPPRQPQPPKPKPK